MNLQSFISASALFFPPLKTKSTRSLPRPPRSQPADVELSIPFEELNSASIIFAVAGAPGHDLLGHAECAARVPAILEALESHQVNQNPRVLQLPEWYLASPEEIAPVHLAKYIKALERTSENARDVANVIVDPAPTYVTQTTYRDALNAAGAAMSLVDHVVAASLEYKNNGGSSSGSVGSQGPVIGFSICRPPGHHAVPANGMGFCLLNNAAVAVKHAQQVHGLKKIAVYDFDVHHGNGTEDVFTTDPSVLFVSTHQDGSYPNTGKADFVGKDAGEGTSINIPLPGDAGHLSALSAFDEIIGPALKRFEPEMIICSAGFDAHWDDQLAGLQFRSGTYHALATQIKQIANEMPSCGGRVVFLLEGGYNLRALGESVASTFNGILGDGVIDSIDPSLLRDEPMEKVKSVLLESRRIHNL
jgi:acetoin utilization deacetylase AcuC-like enzyme